MSRFVVVRNRGDGEHRGEQQVDPVKAGRLEWPVARRRPDRRHELKDEGDQDERAHEDLSTREDPAVRLRLVLRSKHPVAEERQRAEDVWHLLGDERSFPPPRQERNGSLGHAGGMVPPARERLHASDAPTITV